MQTSIDKSSEQTGNINDGKIDEPNLTQNLKDLLDFAHSQTDEGLRMKGPWRLHPSTVSALKDYTADTPPGGWDAFTGLVCGAEYLEADSSVFEPMVEPEDIADLDEAGFRKQLIEGFTRQLIPPKAAAGLFLMLDIHPVWGLRVARRVQREHRTLSTVEPKKLDGVNNEILEQVRALIFDVLDGIIGVLKTLDPDKKYCIEHIIDALGEVVADKRNIHQLDDIESDALDMPVRISGDDELNRLTDFIKEDLFESVLAPAGAVLWLDRDENWFRVREGAFVNVEMD
jgi:hypothetical protein